MYTGDRSWSDVGFEGFLNSRSLLPPTGEVEAELLHTYSRIDPYDTLILCVRLAVLTAVTLTVPIVLFPVSQLPLVGRS